MNIYKAAIVSNSRIENDTFLMKVFSPEIARSILPGQFCNIKVSETDFPLLRRPFSVCDVDGDGVFFMYDIVGEGTKLLSAKNEKDSIDLIAPLGKGFNIEGDYKTAVIIAGGIGAAPFPFLTKKLRGFKKINSFIGGRSKDKVITYGFDNFETATDDGSSGFNGNVVQLFQEKLSSFEKETIKVFACGPNVMLKALKEFCMSEDINCEVSVECAMACGFGICQGCPVEKTQQNDSYYLVCKDGPVFNINEVVL